MSMSRMLYWIAGMYKFCEDFTGTMKLQRVVGTHPHLNGSRR
jgi:hypothetical protein